MLKLLALCLLTSLMFVQIAEARIRHYKWDVKYEYKSPDCYKKLAITINGGTPGPTILAQQGDTIIVEVKNSLMLENLAIHWHGIRQVNTGKYSSIFLLETDSCLKYSCIIPYFINPYSFVRFAADWNTWDGWNRWGDPMSNSSWRYLQIRV